MKCLRAGNVNDLAPGTCTSVELDGEYGVALANLNGEIFALDNTCPHAGGPLGEGTLEDEHVVCPWHGWKFHVRTGYRKSNPNEAWKVPTYETRVVDDIIHVVMPQPEQV